MRIVSLRDQPAELDLVAKWVWETWGRHDPGVTLAIQTDRLRAEFLSHTDPHPACFLGILDDRIIGTASLSITDGLPPPWDTVTPWLASVFVMPDARGNGVASALVRHVMGLARELDFPDIHLFTPDQQSLYRGLGFVGVGVSQSRDYQVDVMRAPLNA